MRLLLLLVLALAAGRGHADVFRCAMADGRTLYSDAPCPRGSTAADISAAIGACTDAQCQAEHEQRARVAQERLQRDRATLAAMTAERRRTEADALAERIRLEELRRLTAIEERLAAEAQAAAQPSWFVPASPWFPVSPCIGPCVRPPIKPRPPFDHRPGRPREPSVSLRDPPRPASLPRPPK